jgi:hypothetical protein
MSTRSRQQDVSAAANQATIPQWFGRQRTGNLPHVNKPVYLTVADISRFGVASSAKCEHVSESSIESMISESGMKRHHRRPDGLPVYDAGAVHRLFNPVIKKPWTRHDC